MTKIFYFVLIFFALASCIEEFQSPQKKDQPKPSVKTKQSNCVYWYLVSSEKSNNNTNTSQKFVYSSCTDYNAQTEYTPENTEDTSTLISAGGISLPTNPSVNDKYEYTSPEGDYVRYNFTSDRGWRVIERILPLTVVQEYSDVYTFLYTTIPVDGKVVFGLDDLYYTYQGDYERWHGAPK